MEKNINIQIMNKILLLLLLICPTIILSQYTSQNDGDWTVGSTWVGGSYPVLVSGIKLSNDVTISQLTEVTLNGSLEVQSGVNLLIEGTLIITGNITFKNGCSIVVESGGVLHILSSGTNSNNSTDVTINGTLIIDNDFEAGSGSEINGSGVVDIGGSSSGSGTIFGINTGCNDCVFVSTLPIELINFEAEELYNCINLKWSTASQINNDYFAIHKSYDGYYWHEIGRVFGEGNVHTIVEYEWLDTEIDYGLVYYKLSQTDYDGYYEEFKPISVMVVNKENKIIETINFLGSKVNDSFNGFVINIYDDGSFEKIYKE